jgi:opacity protein-like surface antigen
MPAKVAASKPESLNAMKFRVLFGSAGLIFCVGPMAASAQQHYTFPEGAGPYTRLEMGGSVFQDGKLTQFGGPANSTVTYDVGFAASAAFGYAFNQYLAADFETGTIGTQIHSVSGYYLNSTYLNNVPFVANLTLSVPIPRTLLVPYIGAGVGGSWSWFSTDGFGTSTVAVFGDESEVVFAWQAFAGLRLKLNDNMSLGIGYKYFVTQDTTFTYPPGYPGSGPDLSLTFTGIRSHTALVAFQARF